jgi:exocyst complex component 2
MCPIHMINISPFFVSGPLQESAVWIDETQTYHVMYSRSHGASPMATEGADDPLGISDEANELVLNQEIYLVCP